MTDHKLITKNRRLSLQVHQRKVLVRISLKVAYRHGRDRCLLRYWEQEADFVQTIALLELGTQEMRSAIMRV
jgi:hypothetical protein